MRSLSGSLFVAGFLVPHQAAADWTLNMDPGVTEISRSVFDLHMAIFYICVAIGVLVFGTMLWSIIHHRKSRNAKAHPFHESLLVEILWTFVPFAILVAMAVPASSTLIKMYENSDADLDIQITGYQWKWRYHYLEQDVDFFSALSTPREQITNESAKGEHYLLEVDRPLVLPANRKIRFLVTSFTATPMFLAGLSGLIPLLWLNVLIGMAAVGYTIYLLYTGVPVIMKIPKDRAFFFSSSILTVGMVVLVGMLATTAVLWGTVMVPEFR